ncbi:MAG: desulfoferrodoxin FeS4 iron-binding domain-containing protein [Candidatus Lokiarchaeota archaeon]|nr:desulfoferrodoxin FeS4 iron-binding domain-containing protein [Candidatus Lokiarchaeota archaeon]
MMKQKEIYKCNICGKVIEILNPAAPETICCGQSMVLQDEKTADWKGEKHVPKITIEGNKVTVDVGVSMGTPHPMTDEHYIMWIELICKDNCYKRQMLAPGMEPKATFVVADTSNLVAREYCNKHGLWKGTE